MVQFHFYYGGDWNVPLNYSMDTLNYMHKSNEKTQKQIHFMMEQLDLVDSFRELNPHIKEAHSNHHQLLLMSYLSFQFYVVDL
jgi:hypothetical protein